MKNIKRKTTDFVLLISSTILVNFATAFPANAESVDPHAKLRATNLARNTAISLNGGLSKYRPDSCMFDSAQQVGNCLRVHDSYGFIFSFLGGEPGWQQLGIRPNTETVLHLSPSGKEIISIIYNGTPRSGQ